MFLVSIATRLTLKKDGLLRYTKSAGELVGQKRTGRIRDLFREDPALTARKCLLHPRTFFNPTNSEDGRCEGGGTSRSRVHGEAGHGACFR